LSWPRWTSLCPIHLSPKAETHHSVREGGAQAGAVNAIAARSRPRYTHRMSHTAPDTLRIAVAQLNPTVGDVAGNLAMARTARAEAAQAGADLVLFTELFIAGYPPEDLVLKPAFVEACARAVEALAADT